MFATITSVGSALGGPIGGAFGSAVGGVAGSMVAKGDFQKGLLLGIGMLNAIDFVFSAITGGGDVVK